MNPVFFLSSRALLCRLLAALMLLVALLPGASRAWTASQLAKAGGDWVEICSAQGMRWVSLRTGEEFKLPAAGDVCQACAAHLPLADLPASNGWQLPERFAEAPAAFLQAPRLLSIWRSAQSRGPPAPFSA